MEWIEIFKAIILGIIEGITEWLPVSSTGHMILVDEFLQLGMSPEFKEMFFVVIQLGAIMAVVLLYWKKIFPFNYRTFLAAFGSPDYSLDECIKKRMWLCRFAYEFRVILNSNSPWMILPFKGFCLSVRSRFCRNNKSLCGHVICVSGIKHVL